MPYSDDLIAASEVENDLSASSSFRSQSQNWIMNSQELLNCEDSYSFPCPPLCPQAVYIRIIIPCWHADPHGRLRFAELVSETQDLLTQY
ncbi:Pkinase Tyr domain containing protein, partial [Asbolus verrucosus]